MFVAILARCAELTRPRAASDRGETRGFSYRNLTYFFQMGNVWWFRNLLLWFELKLPNLIIPHLVNLNFGHRCRKIDTITNNHIHIWFWAQTISVWEFRIQDDHPIVFIADETTKPCGKLFFIFLVASITMMNSQLRFWSDAHEVMQSAVSGKHKLNTMSQWWRIKSDSDWMLIW